MNEKKQSNETLPLITRITAHIETWRPYTVIWCGLLSLCGACLTISGFPPLFLSFLTLSIPVLGWIAGLYLADYIDISLDSIQKSHRPIPSNRIQPNEALITGGLFVLSGVLLTFFLGVEQYIFIIIAGILVYTYARYTKSNGFIGNINRGLLAVISFLFGVFAFVNSISEIPIFIWLFAILFFFHDITTNIVGTLRDIKGDKKAGYNTLPVSYGIKNTVSIILFFIIFWFPITLIVPILFSLANFLFYIIMIVEFFFIVIIFKVSLELRTDFSRKKALTIHKIFVLERITLVCAILFTIVNPYIAGLIYLFSLSLTALFQKILRDQYEFNKWEL